VRQEYLESLVNPNLSDDAQNGNRAVVNFIDHFLGLFAENLVAEAVYQAEAKVGLHDTPPDIDYMTLSSDLDDEPLTE